MRQSFPAAPHGFVRALAAFVFALAFIASSAVPSLAVGGLTGNLTVTVLDAKSRAPISGANIVAVAPSARYTATTDARGFVQINGMTVDTYSVTISAPGFDTLSLSGVTIQGDNTVDLQSQGLNKTLVQIGRSTSRTTASVFQPSQTTDAVTVSGVRVTEALGKQAAISETALALSVPGVQLTNSGRLTIRGGLANEVGYQLDGVNFTEPFLNTNASTNRFNGLGALQVVAGAGDASQGDGGGGVVNVIIKRGSRPAFGFVDAESVGPNFQHQAAAEYGWATTNGRLSDYAAYNGIRQASYVGQPAHGIPAAEVGALFGTNTSKNDDFVNNFVYRFGKDNSQSLQVLYQTRNLQNYGADPSKVGASYYSYYPYNAYSSRGTTNGLAPIGNGGFATPMQFFSDRVFLIDGTPSSPIFAPYQPELLSYNPTRFMKFEYSNLFNASTFLTLPANNWAARNGGTNLLSAPTRPTNAVTGGQRVGISGEITKTFNEQHTVQVGFLVENAKPYWDAAEPYAGYTDVMGNTDPGAANILDFLNPPNKNLPISVTNQCPSADPNSCYLFKAGLFMGTGVPRVPAFGIAYNNTDLRQYAGFIQETFTPNKFLKLNLGLREDLGNFGQGRNPFNPTDLANPDDVGPATVSGFF